MCTKKKKQLVFEDEEVKQNFHVFCGKVQALFAQYPRSRHVVFSQSDTRMMYILYFCKIHELLVYRSHKCHLCIIYDKEKIITMDINTRLPSNNIRSYMKHAELNAVLNLLKITPCPPPQSYGMFIIRFNRGSVLNGSSPCYFCARFLKKHLSYFHSIGFTNEQEQLTILSPDEFKNTDFSHKTQRFKFLMEKK